jgi:3-hydroxyisobutyrate dehydrogenase-like beta-hydroxyacid dehydrogenase
MTVSSADLPFAGNSSPKRIGRSCGWMADMIGLLHPGEMGAAVGARLRDAGHEVGWASDGRSAATKERAESGGLADHGTVPDLLAASDVVLSICPPHAALDVAGSVAAEGYDGVFVDANAVAPATTRSIGEIIATARATFVDGGIVGSPPVEADTTRLYLSGSHAQPVAVLFADTVVEAIVVDDRIGSASAVKMTYAAWTKGMHAMLLAIDAVARREGVDAVLHREWARSLPNLDRRLTRATGAADRKGWRWAGEMDEIARTFGAAGAPSGFHEAAAEVFRRHPLTPDAT